MFPSPRTERAARDFLSLPDPSLALGRIYPHLVWQRTLRTALGHLESAGADLDSLEIPVEAFRRTFPRGVPRVWKLDREPPITAGDVVEIYTTHRALLGRPVELLAQAGVDRFILVSGRAYEARYPHYVHRAEFDTDLVAPAMDAGFSILSVLERNGYPFDTLRVRRLGSSPDATFEIRRWEQDHLLSVGVLVGGYHAHREQLYERGDFVTFRGQEVRAARPEDLLVMLAARVESKRQFGLVNVNDAAVILDSDGMNLDWDLVGAAASTAGLHTTLAVILVRAEALLDRSVVPHSVMQRLKRSSSRIGRMLTRRVADATVALEPVRRPSVDALALGAWKAGGLVRHLRRPHAPSLTSNALLAVEKRVLTKELAALRRGPAVSPALRIAASTRRRSGVICEIAPAFAASERCMLAIRGWRGSRAARERLLAMADLLSSGREPHRCGSIRFDLSASDGS